MYMDDETQFDPEPVDLDELAGKPEPWVQTLMVTVTASVPVIGAAADKILDRIERGRGWDALTMYADVIRQVEVEKFAAALDRDPILRATFSRAIRAAADTGFEAKRRVLARVIGRAVLDDATVDEAQLLVDALGELDAVHFHELERLKRVRDSLPQDDEQQNHSRAMNAWMEVPVPVRAVLSRTGCSLLPVASTSGVMTDVYGPLLVSPFGAQLLDWVREAQEER